MNLRCLGRNTDWKINIRTPSHFSATKKESIWLTRMSPVAISLYLYEYTLQFSSCRIVRMIQMIFHFVVEFSSYEHIDSSIWYTLSSSHSDEFWTSVDVKYGARWLCSKESLSVQCCVLCLYGYEFSPVSYIEPISFYQLRLWNVKEAKAVPFLAPMLVYPDRLWQWHNST